MFVRCRKRFKDGKEHRYWSVVESCRRRDGRVVQRQVLHLGEINDGQRAVWCRAVEVVREGSGTEPMALFAEATSRRSAAVDSAASRDTDAAPSAFAERLWREARRSGFARAPVKVVLGDGAKWIWNVASELFPDAVEIVDLWHAKQHVWDVGRAVHGAETASCSAWSEKTCAALSEGRLDDVLAALRRHEGCDEARRCAGYVEANRSRMRYPEFRAAGLPVGSGIVESSCDAVAGQLKRGGMLWTVERGANPMLALRRRWLDGRHDEFFKARARPPPMALAA